MKLFRVDYTATGNCSGVTTDLSVAGRDADDRAQVIDAHHVLLKGGRGDGKRDDDHDDGRRLMLTVLGTDETGDQSARTVTLSGRSKER